MHSTRKLSPTAYSSVMVANSVSVLNFFPSAFVSLGGSELKCLPTDPDVSGLRPGQWARNLTGANFDCTSKDTEGVEINPQFSAGVCQMHFVGLARKTLKFDFLSF